MYMQDQRIFYTSKNKTSSKKRLYDAHHERSMQKSSMSYTIPITIALKFY